MEYLCDECGAIGDEWDMRLLPDGSGVWCNECFAHGETVLWVADDLDGGDY